MGGGTPPSPDYLDLTVPPLAVHSDMEISIQPWPLQAFSPAQECPAPPHWPCPLHSLTPQHSTLSPPEALSVPLQEDCPEQEDLPLQELPPSPVMPPDLPEEAHAPENKPAAAMAAMEPCFKLEMFILMPFLVSLLIGRSDGIPVRL